MNETRKGEKHQLTKMEIKEPQEDRLKRMKRK